MGLCIGLRSQVFTPRTDQTDHHHLDYLVPLLPLWGFVLDLRVIVQIQPGKHVLDHTDYAGPTRQHGRDHPKIGNRSALPGRLHIDHGVGLDCSAGPAVRRRSDKRFEVAL